MKSDKLVALICYALFFLFIYASLNKLLAFDYYRYDLKRSPLLQSNALLLAITIPAAELLIASLLLPDKTRIYGLAGSVILMFVFTLYTIYVLSFTSERPCTCGGIIRELTWPQHMAFNIVWLLLAILGFKLHREWARRKSSGMLSKPTA
jgi:hypothetical protein